MSGLGCTAFNHAHGAGCINVYDARIRQLQIVEALPHLKKGLETGQKIRSDAQLREAAGIAPDRYVPPPQ
jgi:hypothetical protein